MEMRNAFAPLGCAAAALLCLANPASVDAVEILDFDAKISGLGAVVDGDEARFQERHQVRSGASGGIEDFYLRADVGNLRELVLEGRALIDNHDYLARLLLREEDLGYVEAGYREYRHWYDASGGFFPPSGAYLDLFDDETAIDRSEAWVETGLRAPDLPEITLRYAHDTRDGDKRSLAWGTTRQTDGLGPRSIVPAYLSVDESRDRVAIDVSHRLRKTMTVGGGFRWASRRSDRNRNMALQPGEAVGDRRITDAEDVDSDLVQIRTFTINTLRKQRVQVTTSYAYTELDSDLTGSRIYGSSWGAAFDPMFAQRRANDLGYTSLVGSSRLAEHVGTFNALWAPLRSLRIRAGTRVRNQRVDAVSTSDATNVESAGVIPFLTTTIAPLRADGDSGTLSVEETLEARYTGIRNLVLFGRADLEQRHGDITESLAEQSLGSLRLERDSVVDGFDQRYAAGLNWYPTRGVLFTAKGFIDDRSTDYSHRNDSTSNARTSPDRYSSYIEDYDLRRYGAHGAATWTVAGVRLRGSYDYIRSEIEIAKDLLERIDAAEIRSHAFGLSASWSLGAAYLQSAASYVLNETDTPADDLAGSAGQLVRLVANDYVTGQFIAGVALDERTEAQGLYTFYRADNYEDNSRFSQPYGASLDEHGLSLGIRRQLTDALESSLRYGYFTSDDDEMGGFDDYDGHLIYGSVRYAF